MATVDKCGSSPALPVDGKDNHYIIRTRLDCTATADNLAAADAAAVLEIPIGWELRKVWVKLVQKGTLAAVISDIGDTVGAAVWGATNYAWGSGGTVGLVAGSLIGDTNPALGGYYYTAANQLLLQNSVAVFDGILDIAVEVVKPFA